MYILQPRSLVLWGSRRRCRAELLVLLSAYSFILFSGRPTVAFWRGAEFDGHDRVTAVSAVMFDASAPCAVYGIDTPGVFVPWAWHYKVARMGLSPREAWFGSDRPLLRWYIFIISCTFCCGCIFARSFAHLTAGRVGFSRSAACKRARYLSHNILRLAFRETAVLFSPVLGLVASLKRLLRRPFVGGKLSLIS